MQPEDIPAVYRRLKREYAKHAAPIIELIEAETGDPFKVLVGTILSARTKDQTTAAVCRRLFAVAGTPAALGALPVAEIERLIFPIGFFRNKARQLKALPAALDREFGGRIPAEIDELCRLPGVGRKTANLVRAVAFRKPAICVDVHVHRICNRLGLIDTATPLATEMALRALLPRRYWMSWNRHLVSYGQTVCTPLRPRCNLCAIRRYCARRGLA